jgi:hypothetical protein
MDISGIYNSLLTSQTSSTSSVSQVNNNTAGASLIGATDGSNNVDGIDMSKPGKLFSELKQLQQSDPTKFKQVVTDIANKLDAASKDPANSSASTMLSNMASKFKDVANGGDISELQPPQGHHHHHHHSQTQDATSSYQAQSQSTQANPLASSTAASTGSSSLQDLFNGIFDEVNKAVAA